jgi:hypothetical protein
MMLELQLVNFLNAKYVPNHQKPQLSSALGGGWAPVNGYSVVLSSS